LLFLPSPPPWQWPELRPGEIMPGIPSIVPPDWGEFPPCPPSLFEPPRPPFYDGNTWPNEPTLPPLRPPSRPPWEAVPPWEGVPPFISPWLPHPIQPPPAGPPPLWYPPNWPGIPGVPGGTITFPLPGGGRGNIGIRPRDPFRPFNPPYDWGVSGGWEW
jgi:hypothetical protein